MGDDRADQDRNRRRFTDDAATISTVIGPGADLEGTIRDRGPMDVRGTFRGHLTTSALARIGPQGRVEGTLEVEDTVIEGTVIGTVKASGKVDIRATAHVEADIAAATVAVAEGSVFDGAITMLTSSDRAVITYREKRAPTTPSADEPSPADG